MTIWLASNAGDGPAADFYHGIYYVDEDDEELLCDAVAAPDRVSHVILDMAQSKTAYALSVKLSTTSTNFLDLPGELRNMIYTEYLRDLPWRPSHGSFGIPAVFGLWGLFKHSTFRLTAEQGFYGLQVHLLRQPREHLPSAQSIWSPPIFAVDRQVKMETMSL